MLFVVANAQTIVYLTIVSFSFWSVKDTHHVSWMHL